VTELDVQIFRFLHHALSSWLGPMAVLSAVGGGWGALAVVPMFAFPRSRSAARPLAFVLAITAVLVFALKRMVARVRPCGCLDDIRALVFSAPTDFSFPSGHAAGSFAFTVFLAIVLVKTAPPDARSRLLRRLGAGALLLLAVGVGLSRIALGVHFPGDVLAGALLGATIATVGAHIHLDRRRVSAS